jgi:hypothetical protein
MFKMTQKEEEMLEDYLERFHYVVKRARKNHLDLDTLKLILFHGIIDEWIDVLKLMGKRDVSHLGYEEICGLYKHISLGKSKYGKGPRDTISRVNRLVVGEVSRSGIGDLLDNFKTDILSTLGSQLDTLKIKQNKEEENVALSIFCARCWKKHPLKEFPLDTIDVCGICAENHETKNFPLTTKLKAVYQGDK